MRPLTLCMPWIRWIFVPRHWYVGTSEENYWLTNPIHLERKTFTIKSGQQRYVESLRAIFFSKVMWFQKVSHQSEFLKTIFCCGHMIWGYKLNRPLTISVLLNENNRNPIRGHRRPLITGTKSDHIKSWSILKKSGIAINKTKQRDFNFNMYSHITN